MALTLCLNAQLYKLSGLHKSCTLNLRDPKMHAIFLRYGPLYKANAGPNSMHIAQ